MGLLSRDQILQALESLADELPSATRTELVLAGGAALVLLYSARSSTKDVDGFVVGGARAEDVRSAARRVAASLDLPDDWLNDGAKGYVHGLAPGEVVVDRPSLLVRSLAVHQLLAMKLSAWRDDIDIADAALLLSRMGTDKAEVWRVVEPFLIPGDELKARYAFDDLWEAQRGPS